jgi:hypothetical protein
MANLHQPGGSWRYARRIEENECAVEATSPPTTQGPNYQHDGCGMLAMEERKTDAE